MRSAGPGGTVRAMARKRKKKPQRKHWLASLLTGLALFAAGGIGLLMGATYLNVWPVAAFVLGGAAMVLTLVILLGMGDSTQGYPTADSLTDVQNGL